MVVVSVTDAFKGITPIFAPKTRCFLHEDLRLPKTLHFRNATSAELRRNSERWPDKLTVNSNSCWRDP